MDEPKGPSQISRRSDSLGRRLGALLQLHEQKTAGMPNLNILYEDMLARVTEKVVKGDIVILKHTPCRVVGWGLDTVDQVAGDGREREEEAAAAAAAERAPAWHRRAGSRRALLRLRC